VAGNRRSEGAAGACRTTKRGIEEEVFKAERIGAKFHDGWRKQAISRFDRWSLSVTAMLQHS
jgi:hypothetical protein